MNKKILIVDDERSVREALSKVLQAEGYEVITAENGQQAVEKIRRQAVDLVLLDLGLPVKDGRDTLIWLAQVNPLLPVIIITGQFKQRELAEKLGADAIMEKPLDVPGLLKAISELMNEPPERRTRRASQSAPVFRYLPCDRDLFLKSQHERFITPYPSPGLNRACPPEAMTPNPTTKPNPAKALPRDIPCPVSGTRSATKKILVVDDDPQIRESLQKVLRAEGFEVALAASGQEAVQQFYGDRFDLLLLDVSLPDTSGWDVFGTLTAINPFVPVIVITGKDGQRDLAVLGGIGALIEKPLDVPRLLETVDELLTESPELHRQQLAGRRTDLRYAGRRAGGVA